ncbi:T9SS type A sorting domain-containing protein [Rubricoccus marinus]|uniref:Secretion system C-terminal sorting domain-containing protein n=1 Tax=Rubricoccus marinus TaxID=716817 RepID=A0A259TVL5_9BACT|nr:T9SS type A sorting domain-containing protein [Rubricoccus marinus]OZC01740.1 hypothetical protein BSZ36_01310 [Rubricoccus marinus]
MRHFVTLLVLALLSVSGVAPEASAQTPGSCALGTAEGELDVSNVFARVFNTGSLFFGNTTTNGDGYLAPRFSDHSPLFAAGIWLGGFAEGELRVAGSNYSNFNFYPGPLNEDGMLPDADDCSAFDRIYVVSTADVDRYEASGEATADLAAWPVGLGAPAVDAIGQPLTATSREQVLDLGAGERPVIYGSQTAWWVMNDVGAPHTARETPPLGVEVRVSAFVIAGDAVAGAPEATFYRYEIVNRSANEITGLRAGFFSDPDLGAAGDDYIATDTTRSLVIAYNASPTDLVYGIPPALGIDLLNGAAASSWFIGGESTTTTGDPITGEQMYNVLQGLWSGGSPVREFGNGYRQPETYPVTPFVLAGDPVTGSFWSEENIDGEGTNGPSGDRRMVITAPPTTLASGASRTVDLAVLFAQGTDRFDSVTELRDISDEVQVAYDDGSLFSLGDALALLPAPTPLAPEAGQYVGALESVAFSWTPVPGAEGYTLRWGDSPEALTSQWVTTETEVSVSARSLVVGSSLRTFYWQVESGANGAVGAASEVQSGEVYVPGVLELASGAPAYVEVARGDGGDPCGPDAVSPDGCDEVGGNLVWRSLNSTGQYYLHDNIHDTSQRFRFTLAAAAPNDFEIRFTAGGGLALSAPEDFYSYRGLSNVIRVPFEIWDIGPVVAGEDNDPADDVRLIPALSSLDVDASGPDIAGTCAFDPSEIPESRALLDGYVESDAISGYYPESSYEDFEGDFLAEVDAAPGGCLETDSRSATLAYLDLSRYPPVGGYTFGSLATAPALPETGTTVRFYTTGAPPPVAAAPLPEASGGIALAVGPNPSRGAATVRVTLAAPEGVRVRLLDMLGREVAVIADGPQASGETAFALPGDLAAGVYAVEAVAGGASRVTRLVTVIR